MSETGCAKQSSYIEVVRNKLEETNKILLEVYERNKRTLSMFRGAEPESECGKSSEPSNTRDQLNYLLDSILSRCVLLDSQSKEFSGIL